MEARFLVLSIFAVGACAAAWFYGLKQVAMLGLGLVALAAGLEAWFQRSRRVAGTCEQLVSVVIIGIAGGGAVAYAAGTVHSGATFAATFTYWCAGAFSLLVSILGASHLILRSRQP